MCKGILTVLPRIWQLWPKSRTKFEDITDVQKLEKGSHDLPKNSPGPTMLITTVNGKLLVSAKDDEELNSWYEDINWRMDAITKGYRERFKEDEKEKKKKVSKKRSKKKLGKEKLLGKEKVDGS